MVRHGCRDASRRTCQVPRLQRPRSRSRRLAEQAKIARGHVEAMLAHYGEHLGLRNARKHIGWYLETSGRAVDAVKAWRRQLCTEENPARVLEGLSEFYDETTYCETRGAAA
jgi:tRNA-dihydrouridine synthase B